MRIKSKKRIILASFIFICFGLLALINFIGKTGRPYYIFFDRIALTAVSVQGILQAIINLMCIFMVFVDYDSGRIFSLVFVSLSLFSNSLAIVISRDLSSLPGIATSFISLITIEVLSRFYKRIALTSITDFVTGLKNRRLFVRTLDDYIASKEPFYLAYFEILNFRHIFDNYGLMAGDQVLRFVSKKIKSGLEKEDVVFRISGANFAVIFNSRTNPEKKIRKIICDCEGEISLSISKNDNNGAEKFCSANLVAGVSRFPEDSIDSLVLTKHADTALSYSKKTGEDKVHFFDSDMKNAQLMQLEAEKLIQESLDKNLFYLVYQPQYEINSKKIRGFETLIRCRTENGKTVSPVEFIPAAEKSNLIYKIDKYVLLQAMKEFKPVLEKTPSKFTLSINVSAKTFSSINFTNDLIDSIALSGFSPENLELEITEYSLAESLQNTISNIQKLRKLGIKFALDDFGTGYTSISELLRLPVNLLKIDKSLIDDIETNEMNRDLVDSVIYMGHIMNCEVISEGVENDTQLELLKKHKCDFIQGFVWGKPLEFEDAVKITGVK